jgi:hypothetical protein
VVNILALYRADHELSIDRTIMAWRLFFDL